jgi:hypothetical protein
VFATGSIRSCEFWSCVVCVGMGKRRFDRKFSLLIVIIVCALVTGLTLTYISDTDGVRSGLRGITHSVHDRLDSDSMPQSESQLIQHEPVKPEPTQVALVFEPTEPESIPVVPVPFLANEIVYPSDAPNNESIGLGIQISYDLFERNNSSMIESDLNTTLLPFSENNSLPSPFSEAITENVRHSELPLLLTMIPSEEIETLIPTSQPSVLIETLQSYFIPINSPPTREILDEIFRSFWMQKSETLGDVNGGHPSEPSSHLVTHFHSALRHGEICSDLVTKNSKIKSNTKLEIASKGLFDPSGLSTLHQRILHELLSRDLSLFIEYSRLNLRYSTPLSFSISSHHPDCLSVLFDSSFGSLQSQSKTLSKPKRICGAMRYPTYISPPSNIIIASPPTSDTLRKNRWKGHFDCFQLVNSFDDILPFPNSEILPFEFEDTLGELLCRCNVTVLPSQLPTSSFFTYWESVDLLLEESMRNIHDSCSIEVNKTSSKKYSRYESEPYWVSRNDVQTVVPLSAEVLLSSPLLHPVSRLHLLAKLISSTQNRSLSARNKPDALQTIGTSLLTANYLTPHGKSRVRIRQPTSEPNTNASKILHTPSREESPSKKPTSSFHFSSSRVTTSPSQNNASSGRRLLISDSYSQGAPKQSPVKFGENELSKKRYQLIPPARATFWSASSHQSTSKDEFDEWMEKESQQNPGSVEHDDDPE